MRSWDGVTQSQTILCVGGLASKRATPVVVQSCPGRNHRARPRFNLLTANHPTHPLGRPASFMMSRTITEWHAQCPLKMWREAQPPEVRRQVAVAYLLGVPASTISALELGDEIPDVHLMFRLELLTDGQVTAHLWIEWLQTRPGSYPHPDDMWPPPQSQN